MLSEGVLTCLESKGHAESLEDSTRNIETNEESARFMSQLLV